MLLDAAAQPLLQMILDLPISHFVRSSVWAYPVLEMLHLIGIGLLFGPIVIYDLRVLAGWGDIATPAAARLLLPWVWTGFIINATSGLLLFASDAIEFAANPAFQAKMALLAIAGLNASLFQFRANPGQLNGPALAISFRAQAAVSLVIWFAIIIAGRMIAYSD